MPDEDKPKLVPWHLRDFPADLKAACQRLAIGAGIGGKTLKDAQIVARLIRQSLGIPKPIETEVLNSQHEDRQEPIRHGAIADAADPAKKGIRDKRKKGPG